jgi:hypothetical protein
MVLTGDEMGFTLKVSVCLLRNCQFEVLKKMKTSVVVISALANCPAQ